MAVLRLYCLLYGDVSTSARGILHVAASDGAFVQNPDGCQRARKARDAGISAGQGAGSDSVSCRSLSACRYPLFGGGWKLYPNTLYQQGSTKTRHGASEPDKGVYKTRHAPSICSLPDFLRGKPGLCNGTHEQFARNEAEAYGLSCTGECVAR